MIARALAAACSFALIASAAQAATIIYTDAAAFDSDVVDAATEAFDDAALIEGLSIVSDYDSVVHGVLRDRVTRNGSGTTFLFANGATAFGGNFDISVSGFGRGLVFTMLFDDGHQEQLSQRITRTSSPFLGFTSDNAFIGVRVDLGGQPIAIKETYALDNLRVRAAPLPTAARAAPVAEPGTWAMMVVGFLGMGGALRRRKLLLPQG